jgi:histone acetyltransferase (RNA polymerase elongator complex component)
MNEDNYSFDIGSMGAIGERGSLLLRINRNCPWNRCLFCSTYKGQKFEYRGPEEIKRDIDVMRFLTEEVKTTSDKLGWSDGVNDGVISAIVGRHPEIYDGGLTESRMLDMRLASLTNVINWLNHGAKAVFLQDANAVIMRTPELIEVIRYLKESFPSIERITSYARSKTCVQKSLKELQELHEAGLSRLLVGIESGCDPVLEYMQKGVNVEEHVEGSRKAIESGMTFVAFVMPGLGSKRWAEGHVGGTARLLNEIKPHLIRLRSLAVQQSSPLYQKWKSGEFEPSTDDEMVDEIEQLIENLVCDCDVETGQLTNILFEIQGHLPQQKESILEIIRHYKTMVPRERLNFRFQRYLRYYLPYVTEEGKRGYQLLRLVREAAESLERYSFESDQKVERAILAIKQRGIP